MSIYLNAFLMLAITVAAFVLLAKLVQALRLRRLVLPWGAGAAVPASPSRLAVEATCMLDPKRRLLLIRCDEQRVVLLTGGPADLVVTLLPAPRAADAST
jgi:flagellar protein FliO/FliZ